MTRPDLSVGQRLAAGSIVIVALIITLGAVVGAAVSRVGALRHEKLTVIAPRAEAAQELEHAVYRQAIAFRNFALTNSAADLAAFQAAKQDVGTRLERLRAIPKDRSGEILLDRIADDIRGHHAAFDAFTALVASGGDRDALRAQEAALSSRRAKILERLHAFVSIQTEKRTAADRAITSALDTVRRTILLLTALIVAASIVTGIIVARSVRAPATRLVEAAEALSGGDFGPALALDSGHPSRTGAGSRRFRDELREASHVFSGMAASLHARESRLAAHSRLSDCLSTSLDPARLASEALRVIAEHVRAEVGVLYLAEDESRTLQPLSTLALEGQAVPVAYGDGLAGQSAVDGRTHVVRGIPAETPLRIRLGFDEAPPRCVVASALTIGDRVVGVLVLGALNDLDLDAVTFVESASSQVAITLDNARSHVRVATLASELQESNETLQVQNEELQAQGEELQAQSEELQAQNEELQAQSEELHTQAEELHAQSDELRAQRNTLIEANSALQHAEEQKNRFLAVLGHELRNPLAAIRGAVNVLDDADEEDVRHAAVLNVMKRQTSQLGRLLDDLLDVGRINSGKIPLTRRTLDLGAVVAHAVTTVLGSPDQELPEVRVEAPERVWVEADETRIEQIVMNLVTNALKYTPATGVITVSVRSEGSRAILEVSDTGTGIEPDLLPRIFDYFVQGEAPPAGQKPGLGLGLALVKTLAELHGGNAQASSAGRGQGATVTVELPALTDAPDAGITASGAEARLPIKRSIVLVEDNYDVRRMMQILLRRAGHTVAEANDGPSGVQTIREVKPDVALVDLDLPGFDGCEVARQLRSDATLGDVRLVALSGYGRPEDRARALAAGFDDHLVKPLEFDRLTTVLADLQTRA